MDPAELLECMQEASAALVELERLIPASSPAVNRQVTQACQHLEYAIALLGAYTTAIPFMRLAD